ncbi:histidine kinase [Jeotgalibacillus campisalis]|uniref:histidine kinase n=2 Tax=Jeotgalibacillus campisalis TaxID=220754 RepID=A0A0C2VQK0_9BACL|nr:histidine kinase [Jeotgalibacillus campisalis]
MLPFYFIFRSSSWIEIAIGVMMILIFFIAYRLTFLTSGWVNYVWVGIAIAISIAMTVVFGFVYFALFLAFMVGNVQNKVGFFILYGVLVLTTIATVNIAFFTQDELFFSQFPFVLISVIGVILLPLNSYNSKKRNKLETQLEAANERISKFIVMEERQRIARDLHDTLGQKLSLIGLKSDLAGKLITVNPETAKKEIQEINQTARTALKEVRELVTDMRGTRLKDELVHVKEILNAAGIAYDIHGASTLQHTPVLVENVLSMCLKEAVTNVVKHSEAFLCEISIEQTSKEIILHVHDDGIGLSSETDLEGGNGLQGMRERLEFVNGSMEINFSNGSSLTIRVPVVIKESKEE